MTRLYSKTAKKQRKQAPLENQFTCIDADQGALVYKYFSSLLDEAAACRFEEHLLFCFRCQEIVFNLDAVFKVLEEERGTIFPEPVVEESTPIFGAATRLKRGKRPV